MAWVCDVPGVPLGESFEQDLREFLNQKVQNLPLISVILTAKVAEMMLKNDRAR